MRGKINLFIVVLLLSVYFILIMKREILMKHYKNVLLDVIKIFDVHKLGRKNKYTTDFYIDNIFRILFYGECWNTFKCNKCDRSTIRKKFYKWKNLDIFTIAYNLLFNKYAKHRTFRELFIDSTIIENLNCSEMIGRYYKIKTKNQFKISVICDNNRVPLVYKISNPAHHDNTFIKPLICDLKCNLHDMSKLMGDKGYITKHKNIQHKNKKVTIVYPYRVNQKKHNNQQNKKLLKKRYIVEQLFSHLKRTYRRLKYGFDRYMVNYNTFFIMACACQIIRAIY